MSPAELYTELLGSILSGGMDSYEKRIVEAFRSRRAALAKQQFLSLKTGDKVRITGSQRQLEGATGVVARKNATRIIVDLDQPIGHWHKGLACPASILEQIT